jgi:hypothetical protein
VEIYIQLIAGGNTKLTFDISTLASTSNIRVIIVVVAMSSTTAPTSKIYYINTRWNCPSV